MNSIWHMHEEGNWYKLKFLPEESGLNDMFEFLEDYNYGGGLMRVNKGMKLDMYYGCMESLIEKGELLTEEEFKNK